MLEIAMSPLKKVFRGGRLEKQNISEMITIRMKACFAFIEFLPFKKIGY